MSRLAESKFDMRLNPCYQVDFNAAASGKTIAASKRRVRFRFGFSNKQAIARGDQGIQCRGEEHEVVLVWSLTSGKRLVLADGKEVHFSMGNRLVDNKFEAFWTMAGGHMIKLIAYAAPPLYPTPGFKQFDLLLDGCSFFSMPKIFELGLKKPSKALVAAGNQERYTNYTMPSPGFAVAPRPVTPPEKSRARLESSPQRDAVPVQDLLDLSSDYKMEQSPSTPSHSHSFATPQPQRLTSSHQFSQYPIAPAPQTHLAIAYEPHTHFVPPPQVTPVYQQYQPFYQSTAAPSDPQVTPGYHHHNHHHQQQPCYHYPATQTQAQGPYYSAAPAYHQVLYNQEQNYHQQPNVSPSDRVHQSPFPDESPAFATPNMEPQELSMTATATIVPSSAKDSEQSHSSLIASVVQNLVNLDDLTELRESPEQIRLREAKERSGPPRSTPRPPTQPEWHLGRNAKLDDIQQNTPAKNPQREIMRTHAFDPAAAQAGMMVVYGSSMQTQQANVVYGQQQPIYRAY